MWHENNRLNPMGPAPSAKGRIYPPAGRCIYCPRDKRHGISALGDEHIVPEGIGGKWLLPDASCKKHEGITSSFEGYLLRHVWIEARTHLKLPTKRPKERPTTFPITTVMPDDTESTITVSAGNKPVTLIWLFYKFPRILRGEMPNDDPPMTVYASGSIWFPVPGMYLPHYYGTKTYHFTHLIEWTRFSRLLAKIGHSYATAELGCGAFEPLLLDIINTRIPKYIGHFIGGYETPDPPTRELHELSLLKYQVGHLKYWVVKIRLWAWLNGPTYFAVAGIAE